MSVASWATQLKVGKEFSFTPPDGYVLNICQAVLEIEDKIMEKSKYALKVQTSDYLGSPLNYIACILRPKFQEQTQINLVFAYDAPFKLILTGGQGGTVHVSGHLQPSPALMEGDFENPTTKKKKWIPLTVTLLLGVSLAGTVQLFGWPVAKLLSPATR